MTEIPLESMLKKPLAHQDSYGNPWKKKTSKIELENTSKSYVRFPESARLEWPKKMGKWSQFFRLMLCHVVPNCGSL